MALTATLKLFVWFLHFLFNDHVTHRKLLLWLGLISVKQKITCDMMSLIKVLEAEDRYRKRPEAQSGLQMSEFMSVLFVSFSSDLHDFLCLVRMWWTSSSKHTKTDNIGTSWRLRRFVWCSVRNLTFYKLFACCSPCSSTNRFNFHWPTFS